MKHLWCTCKLQLSQLKASIDAISFWKLLTYSSYNTRRDNPTNSFTQPTIILCPMNELPIRSQSVHSVNDNTLVNYILVYP